MAGAQQPTQKMAPAKPGVAAQKTERPKFKAIWEPVNYKQDLTLTGVFFVSDEEGWVTGEHGTILHTKDGGNTWTAQLGGDPQAIEYVRRGAIPQAWGVVEYVFLSPAAGVMLDGNNNVSQILRTNNGGGNWKEVMTPKACQDRKST